CNNMQRVYLSDTVAHKIKDYILEHNIQEGTKLPTVSEWMDILQVGRSTLREGLKKLETEQVIEVKNGKGIFVKKKKHFRIYTTFNVVDKEAYIFEIFDVKKV